MNHFGEKLEQDRKNFVVSQCKTGSGRQVCLTRDYYQHLLREYMGV